MVEKSEFLEARRDCRMGLKAFQNVRSSLCAFTRLCELVNSDDHLLLEALFNVAVIRYCKPFIATHSEDGRIRYPSKRLKTRPGFSKRVHDHLIEVRHTLVAHDDFSRIEPRILLLGLKVDGSDRSIPVSVVISNKCLAYPSELQFAIQCREHVNAALDGIGNMLDDDVRRLREIALKHPEQVASISGYSRDYGRVNIPKGGARLVPPSVIDDPWLENPEPDFSTVHNGYRYEHLQRKVDFHGPERIDLRDGRMGEVVPK